MSSAAESGVCPYSPRNFLDAALLRLRIFPRSMIAGPVRSRPPGAPGWTPPGGRPPGALPQPRCPGSRHASRGEGPAFAPSCSSAKNGTATEHGRADRGRAVLRPGLPGLVSGPLGPGRSPRPSAIIPFGDVEELLECVPMMKCWSAAGRRDPETTYLVITRGDQGATPGGRAEGSLSPRARDQHHRHPGIQDDPPYSDSAARFKPLRRRHRGRL